MIKKNGFIIGFLIVLGIIILIIFVGYSQKSLLDSDGDGINDDEDAFPNDPAEWYDNDGDNFGDNCDIYDYGNCGIV